MLETLLSNVDELRLNLLVYHHQLVTINVLVSLLRVALEEVVNCILGVVWRGLLVVMLLIRSHLLLLLA